MTELSSLLDELAANNPGITLQLDAKETYARFIVGYWFETAVGRKYCCTCGKTFDQAHSKAIGQREEEIAKALVEAEVRREVEARMKAAA